MLINLLHFIVRYFSNMTLFPFIDMEALKSFFHFFIRSALFNFIQLNALGHAQGNNMVLIPFITTMPVTLEIRRVA